MTEFLRRQGDTLLAECALHLFGERFAGPLSYVLGVNKRTAERWASGARGVPPVVWPKIIVLLREKSALLDVIAEELTARCEREDFPQRDAINRELDPELLEHWHDSR